MRRYILDSRWMWELSEIETHCVCTEMLRMETADKDQQLDKYRTQLLDMLTKKGGAREERKPPEHGNILKATEEQNRLLRGITERNDGKIDWLMVKPTPNGGKRGIVPFSACIPHNNSEAL